MRDARLVSEVLLGAPSWSASAFAGYAEERAERMRRLRLAAHAVTLLRVAVGPECAARRRRWFERAAAGRRSSPRCWPRWWGRTGGGADAFTVDMAGRVLSA